MKVTIYTDEGITVVVGAKEVDIETKKAVRRSDTERGMVAGL